MSGALAVGSMGGWVGVCVCVGVVVVVVLTAVIAGDEGEGVKEAVVVRVTGLGWLVGSS